MWTTNSKPAIAERIEAANWKDRTATSVMIWAKNRWLFPASSFQCKYNLLTPTLIYFNPCLDFMKGGNTLFLFVFWGMDILIYLL